MRWTFICAALAGLALLLQGEGEPTEVARVSADADGSLTLVNSPGGVIFTADNLGPGNSTHGDVTLTNTGTLFGALRLSQADLTDVLGAGGGVLSSRLDMLVSDATEPGPPTAVYSGKLGAMPALGLGVLPPGGSRTFSFTATLPHGADDNAYSDAMATVRYVWTLDETDPPPSSTPTTAESAEPSAPSVARDQAPRIRVRVPRVQRILASRRFVAYASCNEPCRMRAYAQLPTGRRAKSRMKRVRARLSARGRRVSAGRRVRLIVQLQKRPLAAIGRALRRGRPASLTLVISARDDAGNTTVLRKKVRFRSVRRPRRA